MSVFSDLLDLEQAIVASPRDWGAVFSAFVKLLSDLNKPQTFGAEPGEGDPKEVADRIMAACSNIVPTMSAGEVGKLGDGKILELVTKLLSIIISLL